MDAGFEEDEGDRGDDGACRFEGSITPIIVPRESAVTNGNPPVRMSAGSRTSTSGRPGRRGDVRHAQHVDQMLFRQIALLADVPLQGREHFRPLEQRLARLPFQPQEFRGRLSIQFDFGLVDELLWEITQRQGFLALLTFLA